jgi:hypothetical protein
MRNENIYKNLFEPLIKFKILKCRVNYENIKKLSFKRILQI